MPLTRLSLLLAQSFSFPFSSESFLAVPAQHNQFCFSRCKRHTAMPVSPASVVDFVDEKSTHDANLDTRAFPSNPTEPNGRAENDEVNGRAENDEVIRVAVLGTGMMGQVRFRVCCCSP